MTSTPGAVEGVRIAGLSRTPHTDDGPPTPSVTVEQTVPGALSVEMWAHVAGEEQGSVELDGDAAADLAFAMIARLPALFGPRLDRARRVTVAALRALLAAEEAQLGKRSGSAALLLDCMLSAHPEAGRAPTRPTHNEE